jgi:uncharacterized protein (TIGR03437 family)
LSSNYTIFEIDPVALAVTAGGTIGVQAYPGKPVITPDGKFLASVNLRPLTGGHSLIQVDLTTKQPTYFPSFGDILGTLVPEGVDSSGLDHMYSVSTTGRLYDFALGGTVTVNCSSALNQQFLSCPSLQTFSAVQFSNETPPQTMWATVPTNNNTNSTVLYQLSIPSETVGQLILNAQQDPGLQLGRISLSPLAGATQIYGFNNNQSVSPSQKSAQPIIARLLDASGRGIYRGSISFVPSANATAAGLTVNTPTVITGSGGYAQTYITAPTTPGQYVVTATTGQTGVGTFDFTITVTGTTGGGTGTGSAGSLNYVGGNGQVVMESQLASQQFKVQLLDSNNNPVSGASIVYTIVSSTNTALTGSFGGSLQVTATTDANGYASVGFNAPNGVSYSGSSYIQSTIQAVGPLGNPVTFVITTIASTLTNGNLAPSPTVFLGYRDNNNVVQTEFPNGIFYTGANGSVQKGAFYAYVTVSAGPQEAQPLPNVGMRVTYVDPSFTTPQPANGVPFVGASCVNNPLSDNTGLVSCDLKFQVLTYATPQPTASNPSPVPVAVPASLPQGQKSLTGDVWFYVGELQYFHGTITVTVGSASTITILNPKGANGQSGKPGALLPVPLQVQVTDAGGDALANQTVTWSVVAGTATLSATKTTTNSGGISQVSVTLGAQAGPVQIKAAVTADANGNPLTTPLSAVFSETIVVVVNSLSPVSGDNQNTFTNGTFTNPLTVIAKDINGAPVPNVAVNFAATNGASVNPSTATTGSDGTASTKVTAGSTAGTVTVTASVSGFTTSFTSLIVSLPGPQITAASFLNAAALTQGLPGLTPCGLAVVQAPGVAPNVNGTITPPAFGPLPTSLGPVQSLNIGGYPAPLTSVSNINGVQTVGFQTPCEVPLGSANVVMNVAGGTTTVTNVTVSEYSVGMFQSQASDGNYYAVAQRVSADGSFIGPNNPAQRGDIIRVYVTGLGQTSPAIATNTAGTGTQLVNAQIIGGVNNAGVLVVKAGYLGSQIGYYYVDMQIPPDTTPGPYQPIAVAVQLQDGSLLFGNGVYLPIQ